MRTEILELLEKNSRLSAGEIAAMLNLDESTVEKEIKTMEKEKIICGYHALVD